ncbi:discoidin domain-containing protein [Chitinophagaceae bacterium LB-8]|uniref:Discoidin domain-containing protein n=1 Tax=Paraflavisolibacter caeni TaxID=2982496 RepID=A0A9X3B6M4_9BACT|nr:discoidin domain-containing protein [Paraflavisolibacter caeni]MCU7548255.1 discoidin domain-containing protein [Paraflavisolibacter caeni]
MNQHFFYILPGSIMKSFYKHLLLFINPIYVNQSNHNKRIFFFIVKQLFKGNYSVYFFLFVMNFTIRLYAQEIGMPSTLPNVRYHLTSRPWIPLNISENTYLDKVEGLVRRTVNFQDSNGAIIDPYENNEMQYATPYFANAIATLISAGRASDLLDEGVSAMNKATTDVAEGASSIPDNHGEFFLAPLAVAIPLYAPYVSTSQIQIWRTRMSIPVNKIIRGRTHNWRTYAMKGEWYRAKYGFIQKDKAVNWIEDSWINTQKSRLINNLWNFYHDSTSNPDTWPYESAARSNLLAMVADGYDGASQGDILNILMKGTQSSLLYQDPSGQGVAGGRSGNHTWNDLVLANSFETMAEIAFNQGDTLLAGQYRHAAALGFQSVQRWQRSDGTYSVTKNHFDPQIRNRYAGYSFFTNYNGYMMYHIAENYLRHRTAIAEKPAPNEIGGYTIVSDTSLSTAIANAGGMHIEVCMRGSTDLNNDLYWTTLGVVRFARPGWDSRLGPSDGIRETKSGLGISFAPTFLENNNWVRLASLPERYEAFFSTQFTHPLLVRCRINYKPKRGQTGPTFTNDFIIIPDGILSILTSSTTNYGITWPILTFDGTSYLNYHLTSHIASTSFSNESDQQNFIALHSSPTITATDTTRRSSYGDLLPVRMISGTDSNITFIYPRNIQDPDADSVQKSFIRKGNDFTSILGSVKGNIYIGRTSAGGEASTIDLNNDSTAEATFDTTTGFLMQLQMGEITKIETDRAVTAIVYGQTINLQPYTPVDIHNPQKVIITNVLASADDGNVAFNTIDRKYNTRWSAQEDSQWIRYSFDTIEVIKTVKVAWYRGNERKAYFIIQSSLDSTNWTTLYTGHSSGQTTHFEPYHLTPAQARYLRIVCNGNSMNSWNAITEVEFIKEDEYFIDPTQVTKAR